MHTTRWITLNYVGLMLWVFVWMIDQTRMRGKNVWVWLLPFILAPLPTLMVLILFLQRRMKAANGLCPPPTWIWTGRCSFLIFPSAQEAARARMPKALCSCVFSFPSPEIL